jgi:surface antigen
MAVAQDRDNSKPATTKTQPAKTQATQAQVAKPQSTGQKPVVHAQTTNPRAEQAQASYRSAEPTAYRATTANVYRVTTGPQSQAYGNANRPVTTRATTTTRGGLSCVPYARSVTGMTVSGNAWQWWHNAAGSYARGRVPEAGSVLAFRSNMRMPMGHVSVVSQVESSRVVYIDHANWPIGGRRGAVSKGVAVVDVSEHNDWTSVRVALGRGDDYGSIYPTHGFIYNRPDTGTILVSRQTPAPQLALNSPPRDLRPGADRMRPRYPERVFEEVAEAPQSRPDRAYSAPIFTAEPVATAEPIAPAVPVAQEVHVFSSGS